MSAHTGPITRRRAGESTHQPRDALSPRTPTLPRQGSRTSGLTSGHCSLAPGPPRELGPRNRRQYRPRLTLFSSVSLISLWATNVPCWGCPGVACWGAVGCWGLPPPEVFEDLGGCADGSLFRLSSLTPSSFLDFPANNKG